MNYSNAKNLIGLALLWLTVTIMTHGQIRRPEVNTNNRKSLESKLSQKVTTVPKSGSALELLIDITRGYRIPMGIEWIGKPGSPVSIPSGTQPRTVQDLIGFVLRQLPGYKSRVVDGVVNIAPTQLAGDPKNFLNLKIPEFEVIKADIYTTRLLLRHKIDMTLHPEKHRGGGGMGGGQHVVRDDPFKIANINFSGRDLTVREILNKTVIANANTLWVVQFDPSRSFKGEPFISQVAPDGGDRAASRFHWRIIPVDK